MRVFSPLLILLLFSCYPLFAQSEYGYLEIKGKTMRLDQAVENVKIVVYRGKNKFAELHSGKKGRFSFKLEYFHQYLVTVESNHSLITTLEINTQIPRNLLPFWSTYAIDIPLFTEKDTFSIVQHLAEPITKISFVTEHMKFEDNPVYLETKTKEDNHPSPAKVEKEVTIQREDIENTNAEKIQEVKTESNNNKIKKVEKENELLKDYHQKKKTTRSNTSSVKIPDTHLNDDKNKNLDRQIKNKKEIAVNSGIKKEKESDLLKQSAIASNKRISDKPIVKKHTETTASGTKKITELIFKDYKQVLIEENKNGKLFYFQNDKPISRAKYETLIKDL